MSADCNGGINPSIKGARNGKGGGRVKDGKGVGSIKDEKSGGSMNN